MLAARRNLLPNRGRIIFYNDGKEVIPGVQAMARPEHTYGHTAFVINSGSQTLFVAGDLVHHYAVSLSMGGARGLPGGPTPLLASDLVML
jgi:glyoxylase-like metal-dependent hydrolase (beta-lactamase superfamily II)